MYQNSFKISRAFGAFSLCILLNTPKNFRAPSARREKNRLGEYTLQDFPAPRPGWRDEALAAKWAKVREMRRVVTGAIELERAEKRMGSSLQSQPVVYTTPEYLDVFNGLDASELFITSGARLENGEAPAGAFTLEDVAEVAVVPAPASGEKCQRCYQILDEVGGNDEFPGHAPPPSNGPPPPGSHKRAHTGAWTLARLQIYIGCLLA